MRKATQPIIFTTSMFVKHLIFLVEVCVINYIYLMEEIENALNFQFLFYNNLDYELKISNVL